MVTTQRITANTSFFMTALIIQKLLSFIYFTFLARTLGAEGTGQYFFAVSFATMFSVFMDLGLVSVLIREVAKKAEDSRLWFRQIFTLKLILSVLTFLVVVILDSLLFYSDAVRNLIYLTVIIVLMDSFTLLFYGYIRGQQSLKFESRGTIIFQLLVVTIGLPLMHFTNSVFILLTVLFIASLFNLIYSSLILWRKFNLSLGLIYSSDLVKKIWQIALPFALAAIFAKIYAYMDTFLLKMFLGDREVGFYSIAYKITFALQFIPLAFVAALYPAFASYFKDNYERLKMVFEKSFNYLAFIALPLSFGIMALAREIVAKLYTSEFTFSVWPLQILIASIPFLFINFSLACFLNATDRQKINTRNLGLVMILNIVLNLIFIPRLGIWGASLASSVSTLLMFSLNLTAVLRVIKLGAGSFKPLLGSLFSSLLMFLIVLWIKNDVGLILSIVAGGLVYLILMLVTKTLKKEDLWFIKNSFFHNH
jgi:O-antigen/teichoic acid export membrane protein